mmetsp:Transcript_33703/g.104046  ORF Transcript_33703/g.104046 Transcript_33703/m.104046 type:complete len:430 (-) Transcript_33703:44-1333(-)
MGGNGAAEGYNNATGAHHGHHHAHHPPGGASSSAKWCAVTVMFGMLLSAVVFTRMDESLTGPRAPATRAADDGAVAAELQAIAKERKELQRILSELPHRADAAAPPPPTTTTGTSTPPSNAAPQEPSTTSAHADGRKNRFLLFTGFPGGFRPGTKTRNFATWSAAGVLAYSAMHADTDAVIVDANKYSNPKGEHWWRIPAIQEYLPRYEWLLWVDADTVITNFTISLTEFVDKLPHDDTFFIIRKVNIPGISKDLNNGLFLIRNTPLAFEMLREWATMPKVKPHYPTFFDQSDLITLLNANGALSDDHPASPHGDKYLRRTVVQDREGLLLQHYAGKCKDCCERSGERAMFVHWPGDCAASPVEARTAFCKAFRAEELTRIDLQRNRRKGGVSREDLAGVAWAVDQCTNREELDELWRAVEGRGGRSLR